MNYSQQNADALNAFSRTVAAGLLMLAFIAGGYYLDKWLGTSFFIFVGFALGMAFSIYALIVFSRLSKVNESIKNVKPLPPEDE